MYVCNMSGVTVHVLKYFCVIAVDFMFCLPVQLLGMLADRADVSTSASVDIVSDYDEAMHIRTLVHNSTDHTRVKNTARGHFSSELAHDPVPPASMSASTNRRSQQNT